MLKFGILSLTGIIPTDQQSTKLYEQRKNIGKKGIPNQSLIHKRLESCGDLATVLKQDCKNTIFFSISIDSIETTKAISTN